MENIRILNFKRVRGRAESFPKRLIWEVIELFIGPCRMLIEVFIRKDFGERYFRLSSAIATFTVLWCWPVIWQNIKFFVKPFMTALAIASGNPPHPPPPDENALLNLLVSYIGWYLYLLVFLAVCIHHHLSMRRTPGVFNFDRHSRYGGDIHPFFRDFKFKGETVSIRTVECWLEPLPFFVGGIALVVYGQVVGWLLMVSAAVYALSYTEAYNHGDNHVMDIIDEMIVTQQYAESFMNELSHAKIPTTLARLPNDPVKRQAILDRMQDDGDMIPVAD